MGLHICDTIQNIFTVKNNAQNNKIKIGLKNTFRSFILVYFRSESAMAGVCTVAVETMSVGSRLLCLGHNYCRPQDKGAINGELCLGIRSGTKVDCCRKLHLLLKRCVICLGLYPHLLHKLLSLSL